MAQVVRALMTRSRDICAAARHGTRCRPHSEGGMIRLETLIELKLINSSFYVSIHVFELILRLKLDKQLPVEQFEASRALRADSTSVSSTLHPSYSCRVLL